MPMGWVRFIFSLRIPLSFLPNFTAETSPVSFQTTPEDPIIKRIETVGKVQPHVKAKVIDSDGKIVKVGRPGEICVAGYLLQKGYAGTSVAKYSCLCHLDSYWNDKEQTQSVMRKDEDGILWMHTGDEGIMDEEGYLRGVYCSSSPFSFDLKSRID